jgi:hypothetical protein
MPELKVNGPTLVRPKPKNVIETENKPVIPDDEATQEPQPTPSKKARSKTKPPKAVDQAAKPKKNSYPWDEADPKKLKHFNLRINEVERLQVEYVIDNVAGYRSMHQFALIAFQKMLREHLEKLGIN